MRSVLTSDSFYICFLLLFHDYCASLLLWRLRFPFMSDLPGVALLVVQSSFFRHLVEVCGFAPSLVALCAKFPRVWFLSTTDGRTGISSEMTGKLCFARLTNFKQAQAWTKLGYSVNGGLLHPLHAMPRNNLVLFVRQLYHPIVP